MSRARLTLLSLLFVCAATPAAANPIRSSYVCVPAINPNESPIEFRIRETLKCAEGETLMKVQAQKDGTIVLYPAPPPLSPEENRELEKENQELENYKRYHGITSSNPDSK